MGATVPTAPTAPRHADMRGIPLVPALFAGGTLLLHVVTNAFFAYGYFRDEFYYLACSDHLAFGYVDHPPLIAVIARVTRALLGDSLVALRLPSALAHAGVVLLAGLMARDLGGRRFAQALACLPVLLAPVYLGANVLSTIPFDQLCWALCAFFLLRLATTADPRWWLAVGATVGVGLETKHNMAFLALGIAAGVLLTADRRYLRSRWLWYGAALALALALPHLLWQATHGWPTWEFTRNASGEKNARQPPVAFLANQIVAMNPITAPLWIAGLVAFLRQPRFRLMACCYLVPLLVLLATQSARVDYLAPAYPPLYAAGAVAVGRATARRAWLRPVALAPVAFAGLLLLPIGLPILAPQQLGALMDRLGGAGVDDPTKERGKTAQLPQYFADQFGWRELATTVTDIVAALPPDERARAAIFAANYGEAGALTFFAGDRLPPVISGHNTYYLWGPGAATGDVVIVVGYRDPATLRQAFAQVSQVGETRCAYCMDYENHVPIWLARSPTRPLGEIWPTVKHYT